MNPTDQDQFENESLDPLADTDQGVKNEEIDTADGTSMSGPRLIIKRSGVETEDIFSFAPPATIGRFDASVGPVDIDLGALPEASYVSRKHAKIEEHDGVWTIKDLGSSNGTYVLRDDFERVEESEIVDGTEFALGNARFVFRLS